MCVLLQHQPWFSDTNRRSLADPENIHQNLEGPLYVDTMPDGMKIVKYIRLKVWSIDRGEIGIATLSSKLVCQIQYLKNVILLSV
jgi:hypothetical protein